MSANSADCAGQLRYNLLTRSGHGSVDGTEKGLPNAFLSYSRASEGSVHQISEDLMGCGIDEVWWDKRLVGAQSWWDTILHQIRMADVVVCLIDKGMPESTAVRREYQYAIDLGKPLLPVLLSDHVEISTLPIQLAGKQYVDYRPECPDPVAGLMEAVGNLPPAPSLPHPLPPEPEIPISERDYLIEKVSSTEPLAGDVQVDVVSRLKWLMRADDSKQRDFAKASLRQLRGRREILAVVAEDIDAALAKPFDKSGSKKRGKAAALVASVVGLVALLAAGYVYQTKVKFIGQNNSASTIADGTADKVASNNETNTELTDNSTNIVGSGTDESGTTKMSTSSIAENTGSDSKTGDLRDEEQYTPALDGGSQAANADALTNTQSTIVPDEATSKAVEEDKSVSTTHTDMARQKNKEQSSESVVSTAKSDASDSEAANEGVEPAARVTSDDQPLQDERGKTQIISDEVSPEVQDWDMDFMVFEETPFELCGFTQFTVMSNSRVAGNMLEVRSKDRSIPDQPFRGLREQVPADQVVEILPGCRILLSHESTSGVSRIRVRTKGAR